MTLGVALRHRMLAILIGIILPGRAENWPGFRGPGGQGVSAEAVVAPRWDATSKLAWKTAIPGEGWSSPVVWEGRVFVTTATEDGRQCHVLALDAATGRIEWDVGVFTQATGRKENRNSYATPTPVTDGRRVYAVFGDGSFAALDWTGQVVWTNRTYPHYSQHGLGSSPILHGNALIMARDGSSQGPDKAVGWQRPWEEAFIVALDAETGHERWKARRGPSRIGHATPIVIGQGPEEQLICNAGDVVQGFDPETGARIWTARSEGEGVVPSVVVGDGLVFSASGFGNPTIRAWRTGGRGDVTSTHLVWEQSKGVPMIASMLYAAPHLFSVTTAGQAACLEAATGKVLWLERIGAGHSASPVLAGGRVWFCSDKGELTVVKGSAQFEVVARHALNEAVQASMAVSGGRLYVRTERHLHAVGAR
jgi:outer membrane protein assembly factor BamB